MGKWFTQFQALIYAATISIAAILYLITTFATNSALAEKEISMKQYVDQKHESVRGDLDAIKDTLNRIDQRVYEIKKSSDAK